MAEKRKLPARAGREPAAKRRVSEAATQKKKAPTPRVPSPPPPPPEPVEAPLPITIKDGEPIPVLRERQSATLSDKEYQSYAESAVLLAALERSKKKWLSDGILVRYYTKPKKTKREQIEKNNPPKDSMTRVGACDVTVGPHLFDAMIYTVKDPNAPPAIQYAPPPKQMVHYGHPNNFQQYQPYPGNQKRPPYPAAPPGRPPHGYPGTPAPATQHRGPNQAQPQSGQRPPQSGPSGQPAKPSPDPVIQMLATRAAADPELKALMRVVASSQASQEQLRAFQAHIDELNAIIKAREQQERQRNAAAAAAAASTKPLPAPQPATPAPQGRPASPQVVIHQKANPVTNTPSQTQGTTPQAPPTQISSKEPLQPASETKVPSAAASTKPPVDGSPQPQPKPQSQTPAPAPAAPTQAPSSSQSSTATPTVKQEPVTAGPTITQPTPSSSAQPAVSASSTTPGPPSTPAPNTASQVQSPAVQTPQSANNTQQQVPRPGPPYPPYQQQAPYGTQPPAQSRPSQYGSPTPYYRPQAPPARPTPTPLNYKSVVFEFTSPLTPYGSSTSGHAGSGDRYLFPEHSILEWLPNENTILASFLIVKKVDPNTPFPIETAPDAGTGRAKGKGSSKSKKGAKAEKAADTPTPTDIPPKQEPSDNKPDANPSQPDAPGTPAGKPASEANLKEYWQPVTFRIHAANPRILEPLTRVVKPAEEVRKYMNQIMDRAERAPDGFPAFRLPYEDSREIFEAESTPASTVATGTSSRSRPSKTVVKPVEDESEVETNVAELEEEEDLMDFYGAPMGMPPLRV
ncbi:hypothetical protein PEBR_13794 [Penicillium brasilianum]|uniref:SWR1-complex protein 3 domain-containing protein n=1 Tax=Penicillium brasilianum TaxID=104259 RepID=A0A1S9RSA9_PENBI|nr:hypothetical protein PEBR_13794 [Penicillium brasilianum]